MLKLLLNGAEMQHVVHMLLTVCIFAAKSLPY